MDYGVRLIRFADYPVTPWRNGLGVTREIAAAPAARRDQMPSWRISMATIDGDAPFSSYPGQSRMLGVVDGAGIDVTVDGRMHRVLVGETLGPFSGEQSASARPVEGPALDLGLILDPARARGSMEGVGVGPRNLVGLTWFVVSCLDGLQLSLNEREPVTLDRCDTAALDLRAAPIARLTLAIPGGSGAQPGPVQSGPVQSASASAPPASAPSAAVAYLLSVDR